MKWIGHVLLAGTLLMCTVFPGTAFASAKENNVTSLGSASAVKHSNQQATSEKSYLIGLKKGVKSDEFIKKKGYQKKQKKPKKTKRANFVFVSLDQNELKNLSRDAEVSFIEEDGLVHIDAEDAQKEPASKEAAVEASSRETIPWGIKAIGGEHVLQQNDVGSRIKIAVLDSGIANHSDVKVAGGTTFVPETTESTDDNGHGTHVAGIIGALHNDIGVVGASPQAEIYSVKVLDQEGTGSYSQVIQGIEWAIENKMNIISMSFGGSVDSKALHEAILLARESGILLIAAAGNKGFGDETETYPARFPEVVSVGAINQTNQRASFSSTGSEIDLVAPGVDIESTLMNGSYGAKSGTSMAAPHVTGAAAAFWSAHPEISAEEVKAKLYATATPLGNSREYGHGLVNEAYALGLIAGPVSKPGPVEPTPTPKPDDSTFVQSYDKKAAGIVKKLESLKKIATKKGKIELAKEIEQRLHEFMIINMEEHQLPDELGQASKEALATSAREESVNRFYESKKNVFLSLADTYELQNENYEQQVIGSMMKSQGEATALTDTYEPNDSFETAYPISADNTIYESYLSTDTDSDGYSFTPTVSGSVHIAMIIPDDKDYDLFAFDSNHNMVAAAQEGVGIWEQLDFFVEANKPYYILVWGTSGYSATQPYQIVVSKVASVLKRDIPLDIDLPANSSHIFTFTPGTTDSFSIYTGPYGGVGGANDTILELYRDPYFSNLIASNDDANSTTFSEIVANLNAGTAYYVKLYAYGTSPIHARLAATTKKTALPLNAPVDVNLPSKTSKIYQFTATDAGPYKVSTNYFGGNTTSGANDTVLSVYRDPNETQLVAFNDDNNETTFSQVSFPTVAGNTYYVKIAGYNDGNVYARLAASKDPGISLESNVIREALANDGSITATQVVTLANGTFATDMSTGVTVNKLPAGLGISITRLSNTQLRISFTGKATSHTNGNDVPNASVTIAKEKITGALANVTSGYFTFDFTDSTLITLVNPTIPESNVNDGSIAAKLLVTLSSGSFAADMSTGVSIAHLPPGLGFTVKRDSDTQITLTFTGKALNHGNANDVTDASLTIAKAKITGATADATSGNFTFDFIDAPSTNDSYTYQYDKENHLVAILKNGVTYAEFTYDENGNMKSKTTKN